MNGGQKVESQEHWQSTKVTVSFLSDNFGVRVEFAKCQLAIMARQLSLAVIIVDKTL